MKHSAGRVIVAMAATLFIMYLVPFPFYGAFEALGLVALPEAGSPGQFLLSVLVIKIGASIAFVLLFLLARPALGGRWWKYAFLWWLMYAIIEIGQAIGPGYGAAEAVAGILSEAVYFPLSTLAVVRIVR